MRKLKLWKSDGGVECVTLGIDTGGRTTRIAISDEDGMKLAYRLMSLCSGGATNGVETIAEGY